MGRRFESCTAHHSFEKIQTLIFLLRSLLHSKVGVFGHNEPIVDPYRLCDSDAYFLGSVAVTVFWFGGTLERTPSDRKRASPMNLDERLKDARARRAKIMEAKRPAASAEKKKPFIAPPQSDDKEKIDKLRLAVSGQPPRELRSPPVAEKSRRSGVVLVVFGVGILLGAGLMQFQGSFGTPDVVLEEPVAQDVPELVATPIETTPSDEMGTDASDSAIAVEEEPSEKSLADAPEADVTPAEQAPEEQVATDVSEPAGAVAEPEEQLVEDVPELAASPVDPVVQEAEAEQVIPEASTPPLIFAQVSIPAEPQLEPASLSIEVPEADLTIPLVPIIQLLTEAGVDTVPSIGPPPTPVEPETAPSVQVPDIEQSEMIALLDATAAEEAAPEQRVIFPDTDTDSRPVGERTEASALDVGSENLQSDEAPEIDSEPNIIIALREDSSGSELSTDASDEVPITPATDGVQRPIWIFAPGSVTNEVLERTQTTAEALNLSLQAVNRVNFRISRTQVRYYDRESAEAAVQLAAQIDAVPRDFSTSGIDAQPGTLEVYLAGRSTGARSASTASNQRAAPSNNADRLRNSVIDRIRAGLGN